MDWNYSIVKEEKGILVAGLLSEEQENTLQPKHLIFSDKLTLEQVKNYLRMAKECLTTQNINDMPLKEGLESVVENKTGLLPLEGELILKPLNETPWASKTAYFYS